VFGSLTQVTEPNPAAGANHETCYSYDVLNHLLQVTMPRHGVTGAPRFSPA